MGRWVCKIRSLESRLIVTTMYTLLLCLVYNFLECLISPLHIKTYVKAGFRSQIIVTVKRLLRGMY